MSSAGEGATAKAAAVCPDGIVPRVSTPADPRRSSRRRHRRSGPTARRARHPTSRRTLDNKCYNTYTRTMPPTLQEEIRQRKPFVSTEEEAMLSIARTAAVLDHTAGEMLKKHGLTVTQYNALRILRGAGAEGLCRNEIRDRLIARVPDATRLLDRLEESGLVTRTREGEDRRFVLS